MVHAEADCQQNSVDLPIGSPSDPFESLTIPIDFKVHRILQYYMTLRAPRESNVDSNIAGFTPLGKQDDQLSLKVVNDFDEPERFTCDRFASGSGHAE